MTLSHGWDELSDHQRHGLAGLAGRAARSLTAGGEDSDPGRRHFALIYLTEIVSDCANRYNAAII